MVDEAVLAAFRGGESDRVEFKASPNSDLREAVCALANDLGGTGRSGYLFVGIADDGTCASMPIDIILLEKLAQIRSDGNLQPLPSIRIERIHIAGCACVVVVVAPTDDPP